MKMDELIFYIGAIALVAWITFSILVFIVKMLELFSMIFYRRYEYFDEMLNSLGYPTLFSFGIVVLWFLYLFIRY